MKIGSGDKVQNMNHFGVAAGGMRCPEPNREHFSAIHFKRHERQPQQYPPWSPEHKKGPTASKAGRGELPQPPGNCRCFGGSSRHIPGGHARGDRCRRLIPRGRSGSQEVVDVVITTMTVMWIHSTGHREHPRHRDRHHWSSSPVPSIRPRLRRRPGHQQRLLMVGPLESGLTRCPRPGTGSGRGPNPGSPGQRERR